MSKEERDEFFLGHKPEFMESSLKSVSGAAARPDGNPNSEISFAGCWNSSPGYICRGTVVCK